MTPKITKDDLIILTQMVFTIIFVILFWFLEHNLKSKCLIIGTFFVGFFVQMIINGFYQEK